MKKQQCIKNRGCFWWNIGFLLLLSGLGLVSSSKVLAVPVWGKIFELKQPDGSIVKVKIWGDEFYRVMESLDGYTVIRDPKTRIICYATLSPDEEELVSTGIRVTEKAPVNLKLKKHIRIKQSAMREKVKRARRRFYEEELRIRKKSTPLRLPITGEVKGICLVVDFPDERGTIPASEIDSFCNQVGYSGYNNNGSVRDYFYDVSDGKLIYTNYVLPEYYTARNNKSYYDADYERARELVYEALEALEANGFDFSQYDSDSDGYIDVINLFYAGARGEGGLWPHSWFVTFSADGVSARRYQITEIENGPTLGTFCHENGHALLDWPDLYDRDRDSKGVGVFCLMCVGCLFDTNPTEPCAYLKATAGWAEITILTGIQTELTVVAGVNSFYKFPHPTLSNEYYLIENRQATGRDSNLFDAGIAIWHIDENGNNDYQQMTPELHYECTLVQADGRWDLEKDVNWGDATDLWAAPDYTTCSPSTNPNTNWWSGEPSGLIITNISTSNVTMKFDKFELMHYEFETFKWSKTDYYNVTMDTEFKIRDFKCVPTQKLVEFTIENGPPSGTCRFVLPWRLLHENIQVKIDDTLISASITETPDVNTVVSFNCDYTGTPRLVKVNGNIIVGDFTGGGGSGYSPDGKINIFELVRTGRAFGTRPGDPDWDRDADIDFSEKINIFDLVKIARWCGTEKITLHHKEQLSDKSQNIILKVAPDSVLDLGIEDTFKIDIMVDNVNDLYASSFSISWDSRIINFLSVERGDFLEGEDTYFTYGKTYSDSITDIAYTRKGVVSGVNGSGKLATLTFTVVDSGECKLDIYWSALISSDDQEIGHKVKDGYFRNKEVGVEEVEASSILPFALEIISNPISSNAIIRYRILKASKVSLKAYNVAGELVAILVDKVKKPGYYTLNWNTEKLPSNIYFLKLKSSSQVITKKIIILE